MTALADLEQGFDDVPYAGTLGFAKVLESPAVAYSQLQAEYFASTRANSPEVRCSAAPSRKQYTTEHLASADMLMVTWHEQEAGREPELDESEGPPASCLTPPATTICADADASVV